jgi:hypothetical protein
MGDYTSSAVSAPPIYSIPKEKSPEDIRLLVDKLQLEVEKLKNGSLHYEGHLEHHEHHDHSCKSHSHLHRGIHSHSPVKDKSHSRVVIIPEKDKQTVNRQKW